MTTARETTVVVVGEAIVDLVPSGPGTFMATPGGSPANTAVALARLGTPTRLVARLSPDELGELLRAHLEVSGVDLSLSVTGAEPSSVAVVTRGTDGSATYRFLIDGTVDWQWQRDELPPLDDTVVALHAGSLALLRAPALEPWLFAARERATLCIDPNLRPDLMPPDGRERVERWVTAADIVKASVEDLALLYGDEPADTVAQRWRRQGATLVVVTAGAAGATAYVDDVVIHRDAVRVDVVDTIGAGDTFSAAMLHELAARRALGGRLGSVTPDDVDAALALAVSAAALTCTRRGAVPPTMADIARMLG